MLAGFLLTLRESLEAALIIGALLGALKKLDSPRGKREIWLGTVVAVLLSILVGISLNLLGMSFEGRAEEIFEGTTMLLAAGVLTWVLLWMQRQARNIQEELETGVNQALAKNSGWALFSLAFLAVIREGVELAFFLTAAAVDTQISSVLIGAGLGLATTVVLALLLFNSLIRLNLARFFRVTSLILILFAAGLVAHGVHEFNEVGFIPPLIEHVWDINHILDEKSGLGLLLKSLLGYNGNPSLSEVLFYLFYLIGIGGFAFIDQKKAVQIPKEIK
jgi:high-affinity iron transporter